MTGGDETRREVPDSFSAAFGFPPVPRRILFAAMTMRTGGAETHILTLASELVRRGHSVTVASDGGELEDELRSAGVGVEHIPLNRKEAFSVFRTRRQLEALLRRESFDVIHAHARIPAFVCGRVARRHRIPFVTTVHSPFRVTPLLRRVTDWGERVLAVSPDLAAYITTQYGFDPAYVTLTVNGVDPVCFSPAGAGEREALCRKLGLRADVRRVICVSRIDPDADTMPLMLAQIAPDLVRAVPDAEILIVGDGSDMNTLRILAEQANRVTGREAVRLAGSTVSVADYLRISDCFAGVSRSALEAMACGLPAVLGGNGGYLGIFGAESRPLARKTNFCCRYCPPLLAFPLLRDLCAELAMSAAERQEQAEYNREVVLSDYSVGRMADDCEAVYSAVAAEHVGR